MDIIERLETLHEHPTSETKEEPTLGTPTKYTFTEERPDGTVTLTYTIDEDNMNIFNLHEMCKRFAAALGYHTHSIEKVLGESFHEETTI